MSTMDKELLSRIVKTWGLAKVYYVGGCVRDMMLGKEPGDYDLVVDCKDGANIFTDYLRENWSDVCSGFTVFPVYGTAKFDLLGEKIECVMPRTETYREGPRKPDHVSYAGGIEEDAYRRDFCCNALYQDVVSGVVLDPTKRGLDDLKNRILRTPIPGEQTFRDDPLRMLRAFRFAYRLGFTIAPETLECITDYTEYYKLSMERVWSEFSKILVCDNPSQAIRDLHNHNLLTYIIPVLDASWGMNQHSKYHNLDLTEHTLKVLENTRPDLTLRTAALLHDLAKYNNHETREDGSWSYIGHEKESARLSKEILERLRCPGKFIEDVGVIIENHMTLKQNPENITRKRVRKMMRTLGDNLGLTLELIDADNLAHHPDYIIRGQREKVLEIVEEEKNKPQPLKSPVSGRAIMLRLGIQEGIEVGKIKEKMQEWYDENPELTEDELFKKYEDEHKYGRFNEDNL